MDEPRYTVEPVTQRRRPAERAAALVKVIQVPAASG